ncbi:MAG: FapA family protein [Gemmatimonadota bacterium]
MSPLRRTNGRSRDPRGDSSRPGRAREAGTAGSRPAGAAPAPDLPVRLADPARPGHALSAADLRGLSARLAALAGDGAGLVSGDVGDLRALAVGAGEVIARWTDLGGEASPPLRPGHNVQLDGNGEYRAQRYGYVCLVEDALAVLSPLYLDPEALHLYWILLDDRPHPVTVEMLQQCAADLDIAVALDTPRMRDLVGQARAGRARRGRWEIAAGMPPFAGEAERRELLVDLRGRAGKVQADGSIDCCKTGGLPVVAAGQPLARCTPGQPARAGRDLRDHPIEAPAAPAAPLMAGENVRVESTDGIRVFSALIDGAVRLEGDALSVAKFLSVGGDVSFDTGNLRFDGEIHVGGSLVQGFSVEAAGPVTIAGAVEPGSTVVSGADVSVGRGIIGQKTQVRAAGAVRAQFVQEAQVSAGADIELGSFAYQARLECGGVLRVAAGSGPCGGSIVGGRAWARRGVEAHHLGSPALVATEVVTGIEPEQVVQLERLAKGADTSYEHILRILRQFGLTRLDATQIRHLIQASAGPHRKLLANRARQLGQLAKVHQAVVAQKAALDAAVREAACRASIRVSGIAYPGADLRVGEHHRVLDTEVHGARFHIADNRLSDR